MPLVNLSKEDLARIEANDPERRLTKIRTVIKDTEAALDHLGENDEGKSLFEELDNHVTVLRKALLDIIQVAGPQPSGRKKT